MRLGRGSEAVEVEVLRGPGLRDADDTMQIWG